MYVDVEKWFELLQVEGIDMMVKEKENHLDPIKEKPRKAHEQQEYSRQSILWPTLFTCQFAVGND